ncbi:MULTISPECIES: phosphopantetheine-binding protein [unclassified Streptomyces]|uniref:phosphopantetheine-binding protein n=1 Tax=unclassified Streptomyces TaxID=2593676 RepID=UPI0003749366|nr:phosphopantetheine-binding protein [Streptomyces sp. Amel2xE9]MYX28890.1 phosphopantetheine attachment site [Streptomyces sp. SID8381]
MTVDSGFRNPMDELVVGKVRELVGKPDIGIGDDFLAVGGNSIIAVRLGQALRQELGISRITGVILKNPLLSDLSDVLSELVGEAS